MDEMKRKKVVTQITFHNCLIYNDAALLEKNSTKASPDFIQKTALRIIQESNKIQKQLRELTG